MLRWWRIWSDLSIQLAACVVSWCSGGKLGLSIRDVDQTTGRDLLDLEKIRAAQVRRRTYVLLILRVRLVCMTAQVHQLLCLFS